MLITGFILNRSSSEALKREVDMENKSSSLMKLSMEFRVDKKKKTPTTEAVTGLLQLWKQTNTQSKKRKPTEAQKKPEANETGSAPTLF